MKKKTKKKTKSKTNFTIHLNETAIKEMGLPEDQMKIKKTSEIYENANKYLKKYYHNTNLLCEKCKLLGDLILLKGEQGQLAYVKHDLDYQTDKWKLIVELPLDFNIEKQQRGWISCVSKFFKPLFIKEFESVSLENDFFDITQKPYKECRLTEFDPAKPETKTPLKIRFKSYADSAPYASKTTRKQDIESYYEYVWKQYQRLKKEKSNRYDLKYYARYKKIAQKVVGKRFGRLTIIEEPAPFTIRNILTTWSKKISS